MVLAEFLVFFMLKIIKAEVHAICFLQNIKHQIVAFVLLGDKGCLSASQ
jgi:hypothetical protein